MACQPNKVSQVSLQGNVTYALTNQVIVKIAGKYFKAELDQTNHFYLEFELAEPSFGMFIMGNDFQTFYVTPGAEITLKLDQRYFNSSMVFEGSTALYNNFLINTGSTRAIRTSSENMSNNIDELLMSQKKWEKMMKKKVHESGSFSPTWIRSYYKWVELWSYSIRELNHARASNKEGKYLKLYPSYREKAEKLCSEQNMHDVCVFFYRMWLRRDYYDRKFQGKTKGDYYEDRFYAIRKYIPKEYKISVLESEIRYGITSKNAQEEMRDIFTKVKKWKYYSYYEAVFKSLENTYQLYQKDSLGEDIFVYDQNKKKQFLFGKEGVKLIVMETNLEKSKANLPQWLKIAKTRKAKLVILFSFMDFVSFYDQISNSELAPYAYFVADTKGLSRALYLKPLFSNKGYLVQNGKFEKINSLTYLKF